MQTLLLLLLVITADETPPTPPVASITATSGGQPIQEETDGTNLRTINISLGQMIRLSSDKSTHAPNLGSLLWVVEPASIQFEAFPDNSTIILTGPISPSSIVVQQIVTANNTISWQKLRIVCGRQGVPPPIPPIPDVLPDPPATKRFFISLISEARLAKPDEGNVRNSIAYWNGLKLRGHDWIFYDTLTSEKLGVASRLQMEHAKIPPPALIIAHDGKNISVIPLPKTTEGIDAEIKRLGGI